MKPQEHIDILTAQISQQYKLLATVRDDSVEQLRLLQEDLSIANIDPEWTVTELLELLIRLLSVKVDVSSGTIRIEEKILTEDNCVAIGADEFEDNDVIVRIAEILYILDAVIAPDTLNKILEPLALTDAAHAALANKSHVLMQEIVKLFDNATTPHKYTNVETARTSDSLAALTPVINRAFVQESLIAKDNIRVVNTKNVIGNVCTITDTVTILFEPILPP